MSKTYRFEFSDITFGDHDEGMPYPISSDIKAEHEFADGVTWDIILWQFCKFLESTGYVGITDQIKLVDKHGIKTQNMLFECIDQDNDIFTDWKDEDSNEWPFPDDEEDTAVLDRRDGDAT